jgi:hypothetical protein
LHDTLLKDIRQRTLCAATITDGRLVPDCWPRAALAPPRPSSIRPSLRGLHVGPETESICRMRRPRAAVKRGANAAPGRPCSESPSSQQWHRTGR